jgi:hypothetical protein
MGHAVHSLQLRKEGRVKVKKRAGSLALVVLLGFLFDPRLARAGCLEPRRPRDGDADVERALGQSLLREKIRTERQLDARSTTEGTPVPEDLLAEVRAKSEVAGMLLWGLMSDDALVSGHYEGLLSVTSPSRKGDPARSQVYRYTADIRGDETSLEFVIDLAGHPEVRRISGDLWESGRSGRLEILDPAGWPEILRF